VKGTITLDDDGNFGWMMIRKIQLFLNTTFTTFLKRTNLEKITFTKITFTVGISSYV